MKISISTSRFAAAELPEEFEISRNPYGRRMTEEEALVFLEKTDPVGLIAGVEPLTERVLERAASLRVISRCGVGLDSIDLDACSKLGIRVLNTPDAPVVSVAEHAISLALALLKHLIAANASVKSGNWRFYGSSLLAAKTVGIVGCGRIGTQFARLCRAFGSRAVGYDPFVSNHPDIDLRSLEALLDASDIVSLHLPLTEMTRGFVNERIFRLMKPQALLINTSRGEIVDEQALVHALEAGTIAGAAIDVFVEEPYSGRLCGMDDRVLLTPHMASSTKEGRLEMEREAVRNLVAGLVQTGIYAGCE